MYVDQHYIHEVTSPQAFQGLRDAGRKVRRPDLTFGTTDHNVPTVDIFNIRDLISKNQLILWRKTLRNLVLMRLPTVLLVRGLSTWLVLKQVVVNQENLSFVEIVIRRTHGAFGAIAFGIGTSEVEHVFATQCLWQVKPKKMKVEFVGKPQPGVYSKDFILALIARLWR